MMVINITLLFSLFIAFCNAGYSQEFSTNYSTLQNLGIMDKDILYILVTLSDRDGNYSSGFLIGFKSDTLVLLVNNQRRNTGTSVQYGFGGQVSISDNYDVERA